MEWLEDWINDWSGAVLLVSHDRYFMDRIVNTIWEMQFRRVEVYHGNYSAYLTQRSDRHASQLAAYEAQQAFIAKEEDFIRRNMAGQNTRQAKGRLRRLERGHEGDGLFQQIDPQAYFTLYGDATLEERVDGGDAQSWPEPEGP